MSRIAAVLLRGSAWTAGAQGVAIVLQLVYTAVVSRLLPPASFGVYAAALFAIGLIAIATVGGLGQSVARLHELDQREVRAVFTLAAASGTLGACTLVLTSNLIASLFGAPESASSIALAGVAALFAPTVAVQNGLMRRRGRFRALALVTLGAVTLALFVSAALVAATRSPAALVAGPVLTMGLSAAVGIVVLGRESLPGRLTSGLRSHAGFSGRVTLANLLTYASENLPRIVIARSFGVGALGLWNRSETLSTVPLDKLQASVRQTLYPEFRHDQPGRLSTGRWTDIISLTAWLYLPFCAFLAGAMPVAVPLLLGPNWSETVPIAATLAIAAGVRGVTVQLASAFEAIARFRWIWAMNTLVLILQVIFCAAAIAADSLTPLLVGAVAIPVSWHVSQVIVAARGQLLNSRVLAGRYIAVVAMSALGFALAATAATLGTQSAQPLVTGILGLTAAAAAIILLAWLFRRQLGLQYYFMAYFRARTDPERG